MVNGNMYFDAKDELEHIASSTSNKLYLLERSMDEKIGKNRTEFKNDIDRINHDLGDIKFEIEFLEWKNNLSFIKRYFSKFRKFTKEKYFMWKHTNE